jgi:excisionase family DNA binding protein
MGKDNVASVQEGLLSAKEVCEWLGISYTTLWRLNIPHIKLNHLRRFYRSEVKEFLDSKRRRGNYGLRR